MSEPRLHHYVPATYLEGFSNLDGMVYCASNRTMKIFSQKPKDLAKRRDYNTGTFPSGETDRQTVENFFGQFETSYKFDVQAILERKNDFEADRRLLNFVAIQKLRSPLARDFIYFLLDSLISDKAKKSLTDHEISLLQKAREGNRKAIQEVSLRASGHMYAPTIEQLERMNYLVVSTCDSGLLCTSDNSVQIIGLVRRNGHWRTALPTTGVDLALLFPLSKDKLLIGDSRNKPRDRTFQIECAKINNSSTIRRYFSRSLVLSAYQETFGACRDDIDFAQGDKLPLIPNARYETAIKKILGSLQSQLRRP